MIFVTCFSGITPRSEVEGQTVEALVEQHMPFWLLHGEPVTFVSSEDKPFKAERTIVAPGNGFGEYMAIQLQMMLREIVKENSPKPSFIYEYDSFCLELPPYRIWPGLWGTVHASGHVRTIAYRFAMAPWALDVKSASLMLKVSENYLFTGCWDNDRVITAWAMLANVPVLSWDHDGVSENTLCTDTLHAINYMRPMPRFIHGIKSKHSFNRIICAWEAWKKIRGVQ